MSDKQTLEPNAAMIVYQMTEEQLLAFAHSIVAETRDSVAEEVHRRVAAAMGDRFAYCSMEEACTITNKTRQTLSNWIKRGRLHPVYNGNKILFLREEIAQEASV